MTGHTPPSKGPTTLETVRRRIAELSPSGVPCNTPRGTNQTTVLSSTATTSEMHEDLRD